MDFDNVWGEAPPSSSTQTAKRIPSPGLAQGFSSLSTSDFSDEPVLAFGSNVVASDRNDDPFLFSHGVVANGDFNTTATNGGFLDSGDDGGGFDEGSASTQPSAFVNDDDDDFGDFGDFGDAEPDESLGAFDDGGLERGKFAAAPNLSLPPEPGPSRWRPLRLQPMPSQRELANSIEALLAPAFGHVDPALVMTSDPIRQADGIAQILTTPESRAFYQDLLPSSSSPSSPFIRYPAPSWTRSRIRRVHLISLGIPVNLDEVLPVQPPSKALPLMQITTRPMSAPPGSHNRTFPNSANGKHDSTGQARTPQRSPQRTSANGHAAPSNAAFSLNLGPMPEIDRDRIEAALALDPNRLSLLPLATLDAHLTSLQALTNSTQELLSYLLQTREALQQDSEAYNNQIKELVSEATKAKMGAATSRKSSVKTKKSQGRGSTLG